jgi:3-hydroxymyristoyl/3-hydroxydecanoyl-(acyl carrier protein) dehydratase
VGAGHEGAGLPGELSTVKFLQPVLPGAELRIVCSRTTSGGIALRIECEEQLVASATLRPGDAR